MGKMRNRSKKGSVPATILVIGVFAICAFALITFFVSEFRFSNSFAMVDDLRAISVYVDEWHFYENQGLNNYDIQKKIEFPTKDYFSENYLFSLTVQGETKEIKISRKRSSGLLEFNSKKNNVLLYEIDYKFK